ncbi:ribonuclease H-like protein [Scheffersomyces coipomensis]|uniref:ribonuclease H-like protein n=1 Tax=Scheffersomyces coipomensis TaxID=1788519 RepID=UPI00315DC2AF
MFKRENGYFGHIACPEIRKHGNCEILNCIFSHNDDNSNMVNRITLSDQPLLKKQKLHKNEENLPIRPIRTKHLHIEDDVRIQNIKKIIEYFHKDENYNGDRSESIEKEVKILQTSTTIEEYQTKINTLINSTEKLKDPKFILPKELKSRSAPASLAIRKSYIQKLVETIKKYKPEAQTPILMAIDEEYEVASKTSTHTYALTIKRVIYKLQHPDKIKKPVEITKDDYIKMLNDLVISEDKLKDYGYIMEIPETIIPEDKRLCKRCGVEFDKRTILEPTKCHYHPGKIRRKDKLIRFYDCCMTIADDPESEPCNKSTNHVFHWNNPGEMNWATPFKDTEDIYNDNEEKSFALGIDCEMGYTTKGFELLRVTALDFFTGEEVLDSLVQVSGEIIDLNTQWSGVSNIPADSPTFDQVIIDKLGKIMNKNTILIGHGLENDMNAMRLIHHRIIDTSILYPKHAATKRFKHSLKDLAFKYLNRTIQSGEHDSGEDSLAAIDIVKYFVKLDFDKRQNEHKN